MVNTVLFLIALSFSFTLFLLFASTLDMGFFDSLSRLPKGKVKNNMG